MAWIKEASDIWKKVDKKKLVIVIAIVGAGLYIYFILQKKAVQRSMADSLDGWLALKPNELCVENVFVQHDVYPKPRLGAQVQYAPCKLNVSNEASTKERAWYHYPLP